ncbi:MAG: helix-turn-helix domain-containing protein [Thiotrichales bacterium]
MANGYLGTLTLLFSIALIDYFCDETGLTTQYPQIETVTWPKEFFFGPLIYFYTREVTHPGLAPLRGKQWLHFLPGFVHVALSWSMLLLSPERQEAIFAGTDGLPAPDRHFVLLFHDIELPITMAHVMVYLVLSMVLVIRHRSIVRDHFSYTEHINLTWLRNLLAGLLVVYISWFLDEFVSDGSGFLAVILGLSMVVMIYSMGYLGLKQPEIFNGAAPADSVRHAVAAEKTSDPPAKYQNSSMSSDISEMLLEELQQRMQRDKPFLDNKLSLPQLADLMGISINHLSQCINEHLDQNFFEFVNSYRIEEAKMRLRDEQHKRDNILTVAMDSGFNSKSAFYSAFKKQTGVTPSQFRQQVQAGVV